MERRGQFIALLLGGEKSWQRSRGEIEIPSRKPIPYLLSPPINLGYQSLPTPPQLTEDSPSIIQGKEPLLSSLRASSYLLA
ncbi:hypothetical protein MWU78_07390 [Arenibacter sp. F26102]|uniref:hypothetical protein n=1 Tax=Arenibacter sp. F26102 TaxID=2926416 RepID=UPI001FF53CDE|nr:hypothetical protein [Arenibacter sp. F26102]MCK0145460.1 hypothetical protein [Arenibacter sp. F26102]